MSYIRYVIIITYLLFFFQELFLFLSQLLTLRPGFSNVQIKRNTEDVFSANQNTCIEYVSICRLNVTGSRLHEITHFLNVCSLP